MEVTLTAKEAREVLSLLEQYDINVLTLILKTEEIEKMLKGNPHRASLSTRLASSLQKALPGQYFPMEVDDVNLVILSYLNEKELMRFSMASKTIEAFVGQHQNIWRHSIKKDYEVDVGPESPVSNITFYRELRNCKRDYCKLVMAMKRGSAFTSMFSKFWPKDVLDYGHMIKDIEFVNSVKRAVVEEDEKLIFLLIEEDLRYDQGNDLISLSKERNFKRADCNVVYLALENQKVDLLISIFIKFVSQRENMLKVINQVYRPSYCDFIAKLASALPETAADLMGTMLEHKSSNDQVDSILSKEVLSRLGEKSIEDILWKAHGWGHKYTIQRIGTVPAAIRMLEEMVIKNIYYPNFAYFAKELSCSFNIFTSKFLGLCFESHPRSEHAKIVLSYATNPVIPEIIKVSVLYKRVVFCLDALPSQDLKRTYLEHLSDSDLAETIPYSYDRDLLNMFVYRRCEYINWRCKYIKPSSWPNWS